MSLIRGLEGTIHLHFASNDTSGSGDDGATPLVDVRLCGGAADAAPVYSPTPYLLTHASYPEGCHEVAIPVSAANGFAAGNDYAAFCTLLVDSENPSGFIGQFRVVDTGDAPLTETGIAAAVEVDLSDTHGAGSWVGGGSAPTVEQIEAHLAGIHGAGSWQCVGAGSGANPVTLTLKDESLVVAPNVLVVVRDNAENPVPLAVATTDSAGQVELQLDDGTYKVRFGSGMVAYCVTGARYTYDNPYDLTVSGTTAASFSCTTVSMIAGGMSFGEMQGMLDLMIEAKWSATGTQRFPTKLVKHLLNNAHQYLSNALAWYRGVEEISITADTDEYCVTATEREWLGVQYVDDSASLNFLLEEMSLLAYLHLDQTEETSGRPQRWTRHGNKLTLWPIPDDSADTVKVYYVADTPILVNDDDKPTYPGHLHKLLVDMAFGAAHTMMGEVEIGIAMEAQVSAIIERQRHSASMARGTGRISNRSSI